MARKKVKFSVYTDEELKARLDKLAEEEERSLAYITSKAIEFYLENHDKKLVEETPKVETNKKDEDSIFFNTNFNPDDADEF